MQTSPYPSLVRILDLMGGTRGLALSEIRLANFCPYLYVLEVYAGNCSHYLRAKCWRISPLSSSFSTNIRRQGTVAGTSSARQLQLRSLEGQTSLAMVAGEPTTPCDSCNGRGWLVCDFCEGQRVNVQAENRRIYRRCPSCRTAGVVICPRCKVFKCVSFPDDKDAGIGH